MTNLLINFWYGKVTLWKSYWIFGELLNSVVIFIIYNIEIRFFQNLDLYKQLPFLDFASFHFMNKLFILSWTIFITVGIWRSAELYRGWFIWTALTLIFLSFRIYTLRLIFY